jgi:DNA-binding SARP family transcriptional activator
VPVERLQCYKSEMEFRVLGPLEVAEDGRPVPLKRRLTRALLAYMLLHANEPVSSDRLVDQLWGDRPPKTAVASLQNYVAQLRKAIGAQRVQLEPGGYVLRIDPERFDLARFDRLIAEARGAPAAQRVQLLREAIALWRGQPLSDLVFEEFARAEIAQLEERLLSALEDRIDADLELGCGAELVTELGGWSPRIRFVSACARNRCSRSTALVDRLTRSRLSVRHGRRCMTSWGSSRAFGCVH